MRRVLPGILVLISAMACSRNARPPVDAAVPRGPGVVVAQNAAVPADAAVARAAATTSASQPPVGQPSVKAVDFEQLKSFLPDLSGWTTENVRGEEVALPVPYSRAEARYRSDTG